MLKLFVGERTPLKERTTRWDVFAGALADGYGIGAAYSDGPWPEYSPRTGQKLSKPVVAAREIVKEPPTYEVGVKTRTRPKLKKRHPRGPYITSSDNRKRATADGAPTYEGKPHFLCGTTTRYTSNGRCVNCARQHVMRQGQLTVTNIRARRIAIEHGELTYEGKVCPKCQTRTKYVASYRCVECEKAKNAAAKYLYSQVRYGLSPEDYYRMLELGCGICGKKKEETKLCIDHDHKTGKVRSILCVTCNIGVGAFKDDPGLLAKAIEYLTRHASVEGS